MKDGPNISLKTRLFVYISHFLSAWGDRMWQFGIGLFLIELEPESLQLVAIYGFISGAATLLLSTVIGDWVDRTARLKAARISLASQNVFVAVCAGVVFVVHFFLDEIKAEWPDELLLKLSFAIVIFLGICADLASVANTIVIERDWIVELCRRDVNVLSTMSSTLRSIDLTTKLLAPIVTGQVIYFLNIGYGAVFVAGWNIISLFVEYAMIKKVYDRIPSLADQRFKLEEEDEGYAYSQGISESLLGIFMAVGSLFGIAATFSYPVFRKCLGLKSTGLTGMFLQISCLSACVVSVWLTGSPFDLLHRLRTDDINSMSVVNATDDFTTTQISVSIVTEITTADNVTSPAELNNDPESYLSIGVFLCGLIAARFGLWIADLSITQLFLQSVKEKERGLVSGVQNSLNQLMDMLKALMVILAPYPEEFGLLIVISFGFVCTGCLLYIKFLCSNRIVSYG